MRWTERLTAYVSDSAPEGQVIDDDGQPLTWLATQDAIGILTDVASCQVCPLCHITCLLCNVQACWACNVNHCTGNDHADTAAGHIAIARGPFGTDAVCSK